MEADDAVRAHLDALGVPYEVVPCDPALADTAAQVRQFFNLNKIPAAERTIKQTLERINGCVDFKRLQQTNLGSWVSHHSQAKPAGGN